MISVSHYTELADVSWCVSDAIVGATRDDMALYFTGLIKPNYPLPAIRLAVRYDYVGCVNIDDVSDEHDPVIVYMYDSWNMCEC